MARFDVYKFNSKSVPFVLDVQADLLNDLNTRDVVPLIPLNKAQNEVLPKLKPAIDIGEKAYVLITTDIGTVSTSSLGKLTVNIENEHRQTVTEALDFLLQGF